MTQYVTYLDGDMNEVPREEAEFAQIQIESDLTKDGESQIMTTVVRYDPRQGPLTETDTDGGE